MDKSKFLNLFAKFEIKQLILAVVFFQLIVSMNLFSGRALHPQAELLSDMY
ncbi:hypothetical protein HOF65_03780 [bacterium]|nr:hypothetical protein [bacterium]MBT3853095.1 hypothetical protein [bacterium]MBT4633547.1 hypothetical protein [bacterium]MBT6778593.1 hypothetical protein [bacterium]